MTHENTYRDDTINYHFFAAWRVRRVTRIHVKTLHTCIELKLLSLVHFHCQNKLLLTKIFNQHIINTLIYSNMTSFFRFVNKRAIYRLGIISLAHAPVHVTDFPIVNVHVDELSSARIWQHKLCATLSANVNINCRLPIKVYYRICTLRHIRIEIIHESQNVFWVLICVGGY
jgi:hypothetical protein